MPIYEFYCADCHTVFSFLSRSIDTSTRPDCPRCGRKGLDRRPSAFAALRGARESVEADPDSPGDERLERAMMSLAEDPAAMAALEGDDPKAAAGLMRRLYESSGLPMSGAVAEAIRRMEAGEDPETVEAELGGALEEDPLFGSAEAEPKGGTRHRFLPPRKDPELYEL